ncbi:MAG: hypothetical protein V7723_10860 [Sneathiella sp.]|uniref:hypothetical protein n=1 Tax=Sneathiella sp. TaxID=1964365 RepID=UPI003003255D
MSAFIFSVYNANVREAVKDNQEHPHISERWASPCMFEVEADSATAAEDCVKKKYPTAEGFVTKRIEN